MQARLRLCLGGGASNYDPPCASPRRGGAPAASSRLPGRTPSTPPAGRTPGGIAASPGRAPGRVPGAGRRRHGPWAAQALICYKDGRFFQRASSPPARSQRNCNIIERFSEKTTAATTKTPLAIDIDIQQRQGRPGSVIGGGVRDERVRGRHGRRCASKRAAEPSAPALGLGSSPYVVWSALATALREDGVV